MSSFKTSLLSQLGTKDEAREPAVEGSPFGERGGSAPHASASLEAPSRGLLLMIGNLGRTGRSAIGVIVTTWLCFGVASCVPTNRAEFEASAVGGDVGSVSCDGGRYAIQFSPPDLEDTALTVVAVAPRGIGDARVMLFIGKTGPSGLEEMFSSAATNKRRNDWFRSPMLVKAVSRSITITWAQGGHQTAELFFTGPENSVVTNDTYNHFYQQSIAIPDFSGDWLEVRLPSLSFDGHLLETPPIRFELVKRVRFASINC